MTALVRLGYLAKAVVYILMGALAWKVAAGIRGGRITDPGGSLYVVLGQPFGQAMLIFVAAGLLAYSAWQIVSAITGRRRHKHASAINRGLTVVRALVYGAIGVKAMKLAMGLRGGDTGPEPLVRQALSWPLGEWLIVLAGLGVGWYGLVEIKDAFEGRLEPDLDASTLRRRAGSWAMPLARAGIGARGVLMVLVAVGIIRAALMRRPSEAEGLDRSLVILNSLPQGQLLLGAAAAGLLVYGTYQLLHARYAEV